MTTWTPADIRKEEWRNLHRGAFAYAMDVFGPYNNGEFDVEVYIEGDSEPRGTFTIDRDTHVIVDMWDNVESCIADYRKEQGI